MSNVSRSKPGLNAEQEARLHAIQTRRQRLPRKQRGATPGYATIADVEEFVRLVSDRIKTVYIYELDGFCGYEWTMWDPAEMAHEGTLVKTVRLEPEPRGAR